jgi:hypothetical protein
MQEAAKPPEVVSDQVDLEDGGAVEAMIFCLQKEEGLVFERACSRLSLGLESTSHHNQLASPLYQQHHYTCKSHLM